MQQYGDVSQLKKNYYIGDSHTTSDWPRSPEFFIQVGG